MKKIVKIMFFACALLGMNPVFAAKEAPSLDTVRKRALINFVVGMIGDDATKNACLSGDYSRVLDLFKRSIRKKQAAKDFAEKMRNLHPIQKNKAQISAVVGVIAGLIGGYNFAHYSTKAIDAVIKKFTLKIGPITKHFIDPKYSALWRKNLVPNTICASLLIALLSYWATYDMIEGTQPPATQIRG